MKKKKGTKPRYLTRYLIRWDNLFLSNNNPGCPTWTDFPPYAHHFPTRQQAAAMLRKIPHPDRAAVVSRTIDRGLKFQKG